MLHTSRLTLRRFEPADVPELSRIWSDPAVYRYLPFDEPKTPQETIGLIEAFFEDQWEQYGYGVWALEDKVSGAFLGYCGLKFHPDTAEGEVLYGLAQSNWGKGIATEAAQAAVDFGFASGLPKIIAFVQPGNVASRRVMEKLGMRYVGEVQLEEDNVLKYDLLRPTAL